MFRTFVLAVALGVGACASADADVRVFVTSSAAGYGLNLLGPQGDGTGTDPLHEDWPIDPFRPTYSTVYSNNFNEYAYDYYYAYYRVAAYPPIDAPSGTVDNPILIDAAAGEWAYIWFQFRDEPKLAHLNGLIVRVSEAGSWDPASSVVPTWYVQNDMGGLGWKRWDGSATPPGYPEWHLNPQTMLAIDAAGISNAGDQPVNMFDNQAVNGAHLTGVALLGALNAPPGETLYELRIDEIGYSQPPYPSIAESCFFRIVPEPAGVLLVAVVALRSRRQP